MFRADSVGAQKALDALMYTERDYRDNRDIGRWAMEVIRTSNAAGITFQTLGNFNGS